METDIKATIEITLKLNVDEAIWLKGFTKNSQGDPIEESSENHEMRVALYDALPSLSDLLQAKKHKPHDRT